MTIPDAKDRIRVSCSALCRIEIDGKFLLEINKNRGDVLTPIGGALEFYEPAREFLISIGAEFQKGNDLRLTLPVENLSKFQEWFASRRDRETDPVRELKEELIDEHHVLPSWPGDDPPFNFLKAVELEEPTTRKDQQGVLTRYFYEIFQLEMPGPVQSAVLEQIESGQSSLRLISPEELSGNTHSQSIKIGRNTEVTFFDS